MAKTKSLLLSFFFIAVVSVLSSCGIFQSSIQTDEQVRISKCDSIKISVNVPVAVPNIPMLDYIETRYHPEEQCFYAHWCYSVSVDKSIVEKAFTIIEKVTAIVEKIIKIFYQIKT